jgi:hypothetical protein
MKIFNFLIVLLVTFLASCGGGQLNQQLVYEKNPQYSWGYAEFFGDYYYPENGNKNNVLSVSLFTDSLKINEVGNLTGIGQYLFLEDVFQAATDTLLQSGTYTVNDSGLPFTVAPGKNDTVDNTVYPIGAYISYYELNAANSTLKIITGGSFTVGISGSKYTIACNFITSDGMDLKGTFNAVLPHIDQSLATQKSGMRPKLIHIRR